MGKLSRKGAYSLKSQKLAFELDDLQQEAIWRGETHYRHVTTTILG